VRSVPLTSSGKLQGTERGTCSAALVEYKGFGRLPNGPYEPGIDPETKVDKSNHRHANR
jgi:hypothetical protein